jgi:hypothetical protein
MTITTIKEMNKFIECIRTTDFYISQIYLNGGCYQFHLLLKNFAPESEPRINKEKTHIVTYFKGKHFDVLGTVDSTIEYCPLTEEDVQMASKWSFSKSRLIQLKECPHCCEPITV